MIPSALMAMSLSALCGCAHLEAVLKQPARAPVPAVAKVGTPTPPPAPLRPDLSAEDQQKVMDDARQKIGEVERLLREVEGRALNKFQLEAFRASQNFLDQARTALDQRDYQRAANLAGKARALGDDLAAGTR